MAEFSLETFRAERDAKRDLLGRQWKPSAADVIAAYAAGERDFWWATLDGANLYRANLSRATLDGANLDGANLSMANLSGANLINAHGLYQAFAPGLSSRGDSLYAHLVLVSGEIALRFSAGCQSELTAAELRNRVERTHSTNSHAQQYEAAITFIEVSFAVDMATGRWDYLKNWRAPETKTEREAHEQQL